MGSRGLPVSYSRNQASSSCCCLHLQFLQTVQGNLKLFQLMIGSLCESLLVTYGMSYSGTIGAAFVSLMSTTSSCLWTTSLLLFCYIFSLNSYSLIRSSLFVGYFSGTARGIALTNGRFIYYTFLSELIFSTVAAFSFLSASVYMLLSVKMFLYPLYIINVPLYATAYPAMVASYMLGFVLCILYGMDAYHAYRHYKA